MKSSFSSLITSPTWMSRHLRSSKVSVGVSTLALRALSSESDAWRFWIGMISYVMHGGVMDATCQVFLDFFECTGEEYDG